MTASPDSRVLIYPVSPFDLGISFELVGDDDPQEGTGAWQDVPRPRRRTAIEWTGEPSATYVLPLMLDGIDRPRRGQSTPVESDIRKLRSWRQKSAKTGQPPVLRVQGPLHFPTTMRWVLDGLAWGEKQRDASGRRVQQLVTVTLREYVEPTVVKSPAKKVRGRGGKKK